MDRDDHDALIRLQGQVEQTAKSIEAHNIASVERDTRIEAKVDRINGTVAKNVTVIAELQARPRLPEWLTADVVTRGVREHQDVLADWPAVKKRVETLWDAFRFGRWIIATVATLLVIVQPIEIIVLQKFW